MFKYQVDKDKYVKVDKDKYVKVYIPIHQEIYLTLACLLKDHFSFYF